GYGPEAVAALRKAELLDPDPNVRPSAMAWTLLGSGDMHGAIATLQAWLRWKPRDAGALSQFRYLRLRSGDIDGARTAFLQAVNHKAEATWTYDPLGTPHWYRGDAAEAASAWQVSRQLYEARLRRNPDDWYAALYFAVLLANCPDPCLRDPKRAA